MQEKGPKSRFVEYIISFLIYGFGLYILSSILNLNFLESFLIPLAILFMFAGGYNLTIMAMDDFVKLKK